MKNFILRLLSLVMVAGALFAYNSVALERRQIVQENENKITKAEAYNESVMALENSEEAAEKNEPTYADGAWEGTGTGFGGDITVSVTVANGKITGVEILSAESEDPAYFEMAKELPDRIVKEQSTEIDTVSGATFSSNGILDAAADALGKAVAQ